MSIIDNEAENWYGGETYMHSAYIAGATRPPTGEEVDMLGFTFTSGKNGHTTLNAQYSNIPKLADDGLDSLSILVILKTLEMWAQKGYELFQPIAQRFHGDGR